MAPSLVTLACRTEALQQAADSAVGRAIDLDSLKSATAGSPLELSMSATTRTQLAALYASSISPMGPLAMGQMAAALPFMGGAMPQPFAGQPAAPPPGWAPQQPPGAPPAAFAPHPPPGHPSPAHRPTAPHHATSTTPAAPGASPAGLAPPPPPAAAGSMYPPQSSAPTTLPTPGMPLPGQSPLVPPSDETAVSAFSVRESTS